MNKAILAAGLLLLTASAQAQAPPQRADAQTNAHTPGFDRPDPARQHQPDGHQHVVYWNDTYDHMDVDVQTAGDAYSTDDLVLKRDRPKAERRMHRKHQG